MQGDFKRTDSRPSSPRLKAGASGPKYLVTVAALLGHELVATTAIYTEPGETDLAEAVEGLG